ncbi:ThiF family adenylyltransferase, partial [Pseudorhodobacter sp.]|uniref:HesA/MoeB/ThiF family protein n=1 Tax=Pseudorhodobacter sp. TaxID=1934400 RepID=UPI002648AABD
MPRAGLPLALLCWGLLVLVHLPVWPQPNMLSAVLGGSLALWLGFGGVAALVLVYRYGLAALRARAAPPAATIKPPVFREVELERYARHIMLREIGGAGQRKLHDARVLVVGAGGLGSPALLYLAAAREGRSGVIDDDLVENSNLQRQV